MCLKGIEAVYRYLLVATPISDSMRKLYRHTWNIKYAVDFSGLLTIWFKPLNVLKRMIMCALISSFHTAYTWL